MNILSRIGRIGGLLHNSSSKILIPFSKNIGETELAMTGLLAVKEVLCIFKASSWFQSHELMVESDCSNVVKWVQLFNSLSFDGVGATQDTNRKLPLLL